GVIHAADNLGGRCLGRAVAAEGADRDDLGTRCNAEETDVRGNRARHAGAVRIRWRIGAATGVVALDDPAGEVRLFRIDLRIDQRDDDVFALSDAVYGAELQFLHDVLRGIAVPAGGAAQLLRQAVGVIGLCRDVKSRAFDLPDHLG